MQYSEGNLIDGRYVLEKMIGSGGFGEVWLARDNQTDMEVAIKIYVAMDKQGLEDFRKEFQLSFNLNHTNLLHANYLGINTEDNRPFLVMPFCPRGSSTKYAGNMTEQEIWKFLKDVSAGLAYLHAQDPPIIHQDIKPDNILVLQNGDFVVTDFGISKQLRLSMRRSASSNSAGAVAYMGPERFNKNYQTIKASDKAFIMRLEDSVRAAVSQASFEKIVGQMREATEAKLKAETVPQVIELTSKEFGFTENEGKGILGHLIDGGDLSLYGLANAVTRHAQDVVSYDRSTELEAAGYQIITMAPALWHQLERL